MTGGFPYTVLMLLLLIAWLAIKSLAETRSILSVVPMLFGVALGFGLSAPAWLAILDLVQGSARELQPAESALAMACSSGIIAWPHLAMLDR